jgi:hypothetical protein
MPKHHNASRKPSPLLVERLLPSHVWSVTPKRLKRLLSEYNAVLCSIPMSSLGKPDCEPRTQFIEKKAANFLSNTSSPLRDEAVSLLMSLGIPNGPMMIFFKPGTAASAIEEVITDGIKDGLNTIILRIEQNLAEADSNMLDTLGIKGEAAGYFKSLCSEYSGTFEELVSTARTL